MPGALRFTPAFERRSGLERLQSPRGPRDAPGSGAGRGETFCSTPTYLGRGLERALELRRAPSGTILSESDIDLLDAPRIRCRRERGGRADDRLAAAPAVLFSGTRTYFDHDATLGDRAGAVSFGTKSAARGAVSSAARDIDARAREPDRIGDEGRLVNAASNLPLLQPGRVGPPAAPHFRAPV